MEVPRLGVKSEIQMPAYTTAIATWDPSCICDLHHSSQQCQILNPLSEARGRTLNPTVPSWIHFCCAMMGTPNFFFSFSNKLRIISLKNAIYLRISVCFTQNFPTFVERKSRKQLFLLWRNINLRKTKEKKHPKKTIRYIRNNQKFRKMQLLNCNYN